MGHSIATLEPAAGLREGGSIRHRPAVQPREPDLAQGIGLAGQFVNDARRGDKVQFCPHCSRILYYEDQGEPEEMMAFESGAFAAEEEAEEE